MKNLTNYFSDVGRGYIDFMRYLDKDADFVPAPVRRGAQVSATATLGAGLVYPVLLAGAAVLMKDPSAVPMVGWVSMAVSSAITSAGSVYFLAEGHRRETGHHLKP